jgi:hypothetical protein
MSFGIFEKFFCRHEIVDLSLRVPFDYVETEIDCNGRKWYYGLNEKGRKWLFDEHLPGVEQNNNGNIEFDRKSVEVSNYRVPEDSPYLKNATEFKLSVKCMIWSR